MTYSLFEIKLLAPLDHTNFDNAVWKFEVDGDVSTLLLIDYALEQFQQKTSKQIRPMLYLSKSLSNLVNKI